MRTTTATPHFRRSRRIPWAALAAYPFALIAVWVSRSRKRGELAELDEFQLRDTGIDPDFVRVEVRKPFWRG